MKLKLFAVLAALIAAPAAAAQELPAAVTDAYGAYTAAIDAGETEAARDAAGRAYEAGEAAGIDANTLAILAQNYAAIMARLGDEAGAATMFARSARLYESVGEPALAVARLDRLAIEAGFRAGEGDAAASRADEVADALEQMPASPERDFELARVRSVQAHVAWNDDQLQTAGQRGREAFELLQGAGAALNADAAYLAYYSGIGQAFARRNRDAAFWFEVARQLFATHDVADHASGVAYAWGHYSRGRLGDSDRRKLLEDLAEAGWIVEPGGVAGDNADAPGAAEPETLEDENNRDARPLRRPGPRYPRRMANNRVQGIALVQFDVDAGGRTENIQVVFAAPHSDFGDASERAVRDWRYLPKLVDGEPVVREGVVTTFEFYMND